MINNTIFVTKILILLKHLPFDFTSAEQNTKGVVVLSVLQYGSKCWTGEIVKDANRHMILQEDDKNTVDRTGEQQNKF